MSTDFVPFFKIVKDFAGASVKTTDELIIPTIGIEPPEVQALGSLYSYQNALNLATAVGSGPVAGGTGSVTLASVGTGASVVVSGTGTNLTVKGFVAGEGVTFQDSGLDVTISSVGVTLGDSGTGSSLVVDGTGPDLSIKKLIAGANISFDDTDPNNIIVSAANSEGGGMVNDSTSTGISLLETQSPADVLVKKLVAGVNVTFDSISDPGAVVISATGGSGSTLPTTERLSATTGGTVANPSATINTSFLNFTQTTGSTTGNLGNGTVDGFSKTITYDTGTTPYVLSIANFLDEYGNVVPQTETFFQAGKTVTYIWNTGKSAWTTVSRLQPYSYTTVTIRLDPADPTQAMAIRNDGYVYPLRGLNTNVLATNTLIPFLTAVSADLATRGGGTVFFPAGKYYFRTWVSTTPYLRILGEPGTKFIPGGDPISQSASISIAAIYNVVQFIEFIGEAPWTNFFIDGVYSETGGISLGYCDYSAIRDCSFNYMSAVSGYRMKGVVMERNICIGTKGGLQSGREVYQCTYTNNYFRDAIDDCLHFFFNAQNNIIANNTVDCFISLTRGGGGVGVRLSNKEAFPENSNVVITGNNFANIANAAIGCAWNVHSVTVTGNTFSQCCTDTREESKFYINGSYACINVSGYFSHHWVISNNTFRDMFRAIVNLGHNSIISNNTYENILRDNVIDARNTVSDTNVLTGKNIVFQGDSHTWKVITKVPMVGQRTGRGVMSDPQSYTSVAPPTMTIVIIPSMPRGVETVSLEIAIAHDGGPLPGTKVSFEYADSDGNPLYIAEETFTVPALTDIITQPRTVIPIVVHLAPKYVLAVFTPPNGEELVLRHMLAGTGTSLTSMNVSGREFDYVLNVNQLLPTNTVVIGEQGANAGQLTLGPQGTGMRQIRHYAFTGTFPSVAANTKVALPVLTATGVLPTDLLFFSSTANLPSSLILGAVTPGTDQITVGMVNFTSTAYTAAENYSITIMAIKL